MKRKNAPLVIIILSFLLIILNFIFTSQTMDAGFWMRILSSVLIIMAMWVTLKHRHR